MTNDTDHQLLVADEFLALADLLEGSADEAWDSPSLCEGWRVREVVAHMTMAARYSAEAFMAELERCGFDFTRLLNELADRDAQLPTEELLSNLRAETLHRWTPPDGSSREALNHVVIHGLDVTAALGVRRCPPDETLRIVLDDLTAGGFHKEFGIDIEGRRLHATDLDWSFGSGVALEGSAEAIALALSGRHVPAGRLDGPSLERIS